MFSFKDVENLYESDVLKKHSKKVWKYIDDALTDYEKAEASLAALGRRHDNYGAKKEHYPLVAQAFIMALKDLLGDEFTDELKVLWQQLFGTLAETMTSHMQ